MEESPKKEKGGNLIFIIIGAAILLIATIGSTIFLSSKIVDSNEKIVSVDEDSQARDSVLDSKIAVIDRDSRDRDSDLDSKIDDLSSAFNDSIEAINKKMVELEKNLNGKVWYLQDQINKNKQAVEELKIDPVVVDDPAKPGKKKKRSSGFDFSELENIGEEFETMFE